MSHTSFQNKTRFVHNSDLSGEVRIITDEGELEVDGQDIVNFVIDYLKRELIGNIESMDNRDFMKQFIKTR